MQKERISLGQAFSLITLYIMGTTVTFGTGGVAKNNTWLSILIAVIAAMPIILFNIKLLTAFPEKDLFEIIQIILGKRLGKPLIFLFICYAYLIGVLDFGISREFVHTVALPETPEIVTLLFLGVLAIWIIRAGIEVMARTAKLLIIIALTVVALALSLASLQYNPDYLKPFLGEGLSPVLKGAFRAFSFPFGESILLLGVIFSFDQQKAVKGAFMGGFLVSGLLVLVLTLRNIVMLGGPYSELQYFPSYTAVSRIRIGDFVQRIEGTVDIVFQTTSFFKISVCLYFVSKGISSLFNIRNYRIVVLPACLIMLFLSLIMFESVMAIKDFNDSIYPYYAFPFQVIFPAILFLVFLIRRRTLPTQD